MSSVCFYFQVHQPYRLNEFGVLDIGRSANYFDDDTNRDVLERVARKSYLPMNALMERLIERHQGRFRVAYSISGVALEQFAAYAPEVLDSFRRLAETGCVEFLGETYHHSLAFVFDKAEFHAQVAQHSRAVERHLGVRPTAFRNTELIYRDDLADEVASMGFEVVLAEGADHILQGRSPTKIYTSAGRTHLPLLLKHYRLSDDIAFRFGDKGWRADALRAEEYAEWLRLAGRGGQSLGLFMDYETFGEHQWEDTGIFDFFEALPAAVLAKGELDFKTPTELARVGALGGTLKVPDYVSWADTERDLSAWLGNEMQRMAARALFDLKAKVQECGDPELIEIWRRLTTSDHLYYMCTKWFSDGDVHKYFNPYESPYVGYIAFMNVLSDLSRRVKAQTPDQRVA